MSTIDTPLGEHRGRASSLAAGLDGPALARAAKDAAVKLDPRRLTGNPVIFATWLVAVLSTISAALIIGRGEDGAFAVQLAVWLCATVLFAHLPECIASGRGMAPAGRLRASPLSPRANPVTGPPPATTPTPPPP